MKKLEWQWWKEHQHQYYGQPVNISYATVITTCYHCKHKETRYKEIKGKFISIDDTHITINTGDHWTTKRHKNRILYIKMKATYYPKKPDDWS